MLQLIIHLLLRLCCILKYGTTQMEVDFDGSFSFPEPQKDNVKCFVDASHLF